jgi:hypothetical protein
MGLRAQQIFQRLTPYRVIADLRLPLENRDGVFFTPHPKFPQYSFEIRGHELVGAEYNNPTPGCNLFDFLEMHYGSYEKGLEHLNSRYFNLATKPSSITLGSLQDELIKSLKSERQQFEEILALREPFRNHSEKLGAAFMYCRRLDLSTDHAWRMFYAASGEEINRALHYPPDDSRAFNPTQLCWVFPYFANHHRVALLEIHDADDKPVRTVKLNPSRYAFFGLHSCLPDNQETRVFGTREEALKMHGDGMKMGDFQVGFLHVLFDPDKATSEPPISSGVFLVSEKTDFNTLVNTRLAFKDFYVADDKCAYADNLPTARWSDYALNQIITGLNEENLEYAPRIASMVESLQGDRPALDQLLRHLERAKHKELVELIRKQLEPQEIFPAAGMRVIETSEGYLAKKSDTDFGSHFTNFLVQIDANVWFEERKETHQLGRVILNGNSVPFLISSDQTQNAKAILTKFQQAANQTGLNKAMPMITDLTFQDTLVTVLAQHTANKPKIIGQESLG